MNSFFRFSERGTSFRTETVAGLTTFMTMAYIIFVNPAILATEGTGLPLSGVFFATCVAAAAASIAMGLFANFPVALASGLGLNAIVAFTLILAEELLTKRHDRRFYLPVVRRNEQLEPPSAILPTMNGSGMSVER